MGRDGFGRKRQITSCVDIGAVSDASLIASCTGMCQCLHLLFSTHITMSSALLCNRHIAVQ